MVKRATRGVMFQGSYRSEALKTEGPFLDILGCQPINPISLLAEENLVTSPPTSPKKAATVLGPTPGIERSLF